MLTVPQLQPKPGDPAPNIVCREVDPPDDEFPTGLAVFRCGKCGWWDNVEFDPKETNPERVRQEALRRHSWNHNREAHKPWDARPSLTA